MKKLTNEEGSVGASRAYSCQNPASLCSWHSENEAEYVGVEAILQEGQLTWECWEEYAEPFGRGSAQSFLHIKRISEEYL